MATVTAFIRTSVKKSIVNIRFRLTDGRNVQLFHKSEFVINPTMWDADKEQYKAKAICNAYDRATFNQNVNERKNLILQIYTNSNNLKIELTSKWLDNQINNKINDISDTSCTNMCVFSNIDLFISTKTLTPGVVRQYKVLYRALQRYELFYAFQNKGFRLTLNNFDESHLFNFVDFLTNEHIYYNMASYSNIYLAVPESRKPAQRGRNTLNSILRKVRSIFLWAISRDLTTNNPFRKYKIEESVYGTPIYISIDERNMLYNFDMSDNKRLVEQRDIFVFQCLVGCRVSDLMRLTPDSIINNAIEYIPSKTKDGRPQTVRVPLNKIALEIIEKYQSDERLSLLPFIAEQRYNDYIKLSFLTAGLTRMVTVINPTTRQEEKRHINEIASSHLARRCFVGNLYKQVKDPNLVGALSGHVNGSKAFARYREIDEEMKIDLVKLLE